MEQPSSGDSRDPINVPPPVDSNTFIASYIQDYVRNYNPDWMGESPDRTLLSKVRYSAGGDSKAYDVLISGLSAAPASLVLLRASFMYALGELGDPRAASTLTRIFETSGPSSFLRKAAAEALSTLGTTGGHRAGGSWGACEGLNRREDAEWSAPRFDCSPWGRKSATGPHGRTPAKGRRPTVFSTEFKRAMVQRILTGEMTTRGSPRCTIPW
jgi:hypothetical protein